jgi:hypothetical protein
MAKFEEASTPSTSNFDTAISGQTNGFFLPAVYSKKVQNFFRKSSVIEAITNTDYTGEISAYGDTVNIIKEPTITTYDYLRGEDTTKTLLTDQELVLTIDQARAFKFIVDDIEMRMSHVNFKDVASSSAAYALKDQKDSNVLAYMSSNVSTSAPDMLIGGDSATKSGDLAHATYAMDIGFASGEIDPIDLLARMARLLDDQQIPEENRWFVAEPAFYEVLAESSSKLLSVDYNAGSGSIRNGLVSSGLLRGFSMYKSSNITHGSNARVCMAGHISAVATAGTLLKVESFRDPASFGDVVRGLHVYGRKLLRDDAVVKAFYLVD